MRIIKHAAAAAAILALGGCAASAGTAAGDAVGGVAWVGAKGGSLAWRGATFAVKTTGRTVVGAARGVHEEFTGERAQAPVERADARYPQGAEARYPESADLANRVKDEGPVGSASQRESASLAD